MSVGLMDINNMKTMRIINEYIQQQQKKLQIIIQIIFQSCAYKISLRSGKIQVKLVIL